MPLTPCTAASAAVLVSKLPLWSTSLLLALSFSASVRSELVSLLEVRSGALGVVVGDAPVVLVSDIGAVRQFLFGH